MKCICLTTSINHLNLTDQVQEQTKAEYLENKNIPTTQRMKAMHKKRNPKIEYNKFPFEQNPFKGLPE